MVFAETLFLFNGTHLNVSDFIYVKNNIYRDIIIEPVFEIYQVKSFVDSTSGQKAESRYAFIVILIEILYKYIGI